MTGADVAVAVVGFQTREVLEPCLRSVIAAGAREIVVVDNGSTDGSNELVRRDFPDVRLIVNECNAGYGAAANRAIRACAAPVVLLLNSDTALEPGALEAFGRYLADHPSAGVVGPRLSNADGTLQRSTLGFPSLADTLVGETGLHRLLARTPVLRERLLRTWSHDRARPVPWVRGAALAIRRSAFDAVGGFDEAYFMYWEEVDLCRRMAAAGFETHFAPVTTVMHARSASTAKVAGAMKREWLVSFGRYLRRHESPRQARRMLALQRALATVKARRDRLRVRLLRDTRRRRAAAESLARWSSLLAERDLWTP